MDKYKEIQWIGRPGEIREASGFLAELFMLDGKYVQTFKAFDLEVPESREIYFNRICNNPVKRRSAVNPADIAVITGDSLIEPASAGVLADKSTVFVTAAHLPPGELECIPGFENNPVLTVDLKSDVFIDFKDAGPLVTFYLPFIAVVATCLDFSPPESIVPAFQRWLSRHLEPEPVKAAVKLAESIIVPILFPPEPRALQPGEQGETLPAAG